MLLNTAQIIDSLKSLGRERRLALLNQCLQIARDEELHIGGTPIPFFPIPLMMEEHQVKSVIDRLEPFFSIMVRLEEFAYSPDGKELLERLMASLTPGGQHLVRQCSFESNYSLLHRQRRFDGFLDPGKGTYKLVEVNQAAPLAIHYHDVGQRIAATFLNELGFPCRPNLVAPHLLEWMLGEYRQRYNDALPETIALVIEHGYPPKLTDLPRMAKACEEIALQCHNHRLSFIVCFPYEITLRAGEIYCGGRRVDMIWRNSVYMTSYREQGLALQDYENICSHPEKHLIINSTRSWLTRSKEVFSLIWDDALMNSLGLSGEKLAAVRDVVPYTVHIAKNPEMKEEIIRNRAAWISKPTDSGFGKGVEFGESLKEEVWKYLVEERSRDGFVFQRVLDYPSMNTLTIDTSGELMEVPIEYDFCPHHINGHFTGTALIRANRRDTCSERSTMNLAAGGLMLPLVTLEGGRRS